MADAYGSANVLELIRRIIECVFPPSGRRRATPTLATGPVRAPSRPHVHLARIDAEEVQLIRPYYAAFLDQQERERQQYRRRALVLATMGMDLPAVAL